MMTSHSNYVYDTCEVMTMLGKDRRRLWKDRNHEDDATMITLEPYDMP